MFEVRTELTIRAKRVLVARSSGAGVIRSHSGAMTVVFTLQEEAFQ
jgi:hypothetical protein